MSKHIRWYQSHKTEKSTYNRERNKRLRNAVLQALGAKCSNCGYDDIRALQIDHINGGGCKEKRNITSTYWKYVLQEIIDGTTKYQVLCANCNWIKRHENYEYRKLK